MPRARHGLPRLAAVLGAAAVGVSGIAAAAAGAGAPAPAVVVTRVAPGLNDVESGGFEPPDVTLAAGPGFVVQVVNLAARIWRTDSGVPVQVSTQTLQALFGVRERERLTDPRILYDAPSGRWLASLSDLDSSSVLLAVSRGSDPTDGWTVVPFLAAGCADQPRLGVADGIVVLAADIFRSCGEGVSPPRGSELWIVNKQQLLDGAPAPAFTTYGPDRSYESLAPVQSMSPTTTEYVVGVDVPVAHVAHLLTVDGIPPDPVRVQEVASPALDILLPPPPAQQPPAAGQSGRGTQIGTNDDRVLDATWENGRLDFSANDGCTPPGDTAQRSCARIVQIATATRSVDFDIDLSDPGSHLFYPAIRPDALGNLIVVYGESGLALLPRLVAVARSPDGQLSAPVVVAESASQAEGGRYGDYFGAARDPLHPETVWITGERGVEVKGVRGWSTVVAAAQVDATGGAAVAGTTLPRVRARAAAGRAGATVRLEYVALGDGSALRERIVVSQGTTAVFSETTTAGDLVSGRRYGVSWRPPSRFRGTLRWCVSVLGAGSESPQSCAAVTLR